MFRAAGIPVAMLGLALMAFGANAAAPTDDATPAGQYRLVGQMETASELLLREDGRFDYLLSVGGLDARRADTWSSDPDTRVVTLRVEGADARIARALQVVGVQPLAEVLDSLAPDHPARGATQGVAVRFESPVAGEVGSLLATAFDAGDAQVDGQDLVEGEVRWNVFATPPAWLGVFGDVGGMALQIEIDVPPPGSVVSVRSDSSQLVDGQGLPLAWRLAQAGDGSLVPADGFSGDDVHERRGPRYVRIKDIGD
ncbi:hypothetical protein [Luteimonas terrae]|uniref:Uncharacterized protein n=1 Tax=Luteimonas terrae TaxID=1530191 RepID=A0ABU1XVY5_9GAMM|nr:hypothetical protein [Luteimonas terrae]MDR7192291.1 hypothetical protein [Luteimonas terrae]